MPGGLCTRSLVPGFRFLFPRNNETSSSGIVFTSPSMPSRATGDAHIAPKVLAQGLEQMLCDWAKKRHKHPLVSKKDSTER